MDGPVGPAPDRPILGTVSARTTLREQLARLPDSPGVYLYRDAADTVLYVGKAKSLRKRVLSYFRAPLSPDDPASLAPRPDVHPKTAELVERIDRVEVLITSGESEALILEANLVKRHRPQFNIRLRDDKSYPYIAISLDEEYPRVYFTRERHRRDRVYFGPFSNASKVRETLNVLARIFPSRPCEGPEPGRPSGVPCLDYHIKRCLAPCVGYITKEEYRALIDQIIAFLSGRYRGLERELDERMRVASQAQEFEQAAIHRNRLAAVRHLMERQWATNEGLGTLDVIGVAMDGDAANVQVLQVRDGVMQDRQSFHLDLAGEDDLGAIVEQFAIEYYALAIAIPPLVLVPAPVEGAALTQLLSDRRGSNVEVRHAERGDKRRLADLAARNARFALDQDRKRHELARNRRRDALAELQRRLDLPAPPVRIECFDISNLGPTYSSASMVVFEDGAPAKRLYRTFTTRYEGDADDFARMEEVITRRFERLAGGGDDPSFGQRPGLVVIDGGKGQLGAALRGMAAAGIEDVPIVSLAKRYEDVYVPGRPDPVSLPEGSAGLRVLQAVRDEAHRFALKHHRGRRDKGMTGSILDALPGIGPSRRAAILRHFGSPERFLQASVDELAGVPGLPPKVARDIHDHLHKTAIPVGVPDIPAEVTESS
jgi:excinuclease ABC subunit C